MDIRLGVDLKRTRGKHRKSRNSAKNSGPLIKTERFTYPTYLDLSNVLEIKLVKPTELKSPGKFITRTSFFCLLSRKRACGCVSWFKVLASATESSDCIGNVFPDADSISIMLED